MSFLSLSTGRTGQSSQGPYGGWKRAPARRLAAVSQSLWDGQNVRGVRLHRGEPLLHEPHRQNWDGRPLQCSLQGETAGRKIRRNQDTPGNGRDAVLGSVCVSPEMGPSCLGPRISGINIRYIWVVGGVLFILLTAHLNIRDQGHQRWTGDRKQKDEITGDKPDCSPSGPVQSSPALPDHQGDWSLS